MIDRKRLMESIRENVCGDGYDAYFRAEAILNAIAEVGRIPILHEDGTLEVHVEDGTKVNRVFVVGDNHFGGLFYEY